MSRGGRHYLPGQFPNLWFKLHQQCFKRPRINQVCVGQWIHVNILSSSRYSNLTVNTCTAYYSISKFYLNPNSTALRTIYNNRIPLSKKIDPCVKRKQKRFLYFSLCHKMADMTLRNSAKCYMKHRVISKRPSSNQKPNPGYICGITFVGNGALPKYETLSLPFTWSYFVSCRILGTFMIGHLLHILTK